MSGYQQSSMQNYSGYTTVNAEGQAGSYASTQPTFQSRSLTQSGSGSAVYSSGGRSSSVGYAQGGSYTVGSPVNQVVAGQAMSAVTGSPTGYTTGYSQGYAVQGPTSPVSLLPPPPTPALMVPARPPPPLRVQ